LSEQFAIPNHNALIRKTISIRAKKPDDVCVVIVIVIIIIIIIVVVVVVVDVSVVLDAMHSGFLRSHTDLLELLLDTSWDTTCNVQAPCSPPDARHPCFNGYDISDAISDMCVLDNRFRVSEHMGQGTPTRAKTNLGLFLRHLLGHPLQLGHNKKGKHLACPPGVSTDMASLM
jgi:hypothetical protein